MLSVLSQKVIMILKGRVETFGSGGYFYGTDCGDSGGFIGAYLSPNSSDCIC